MQMRPMMKIAAAVAVAGSLAAACAQQASIDNAQTAPEPAALEAVHSTVKPGASVTFSHSLRGEIDASRRGSVDIQVTEEYSDGLLHLTAAGEDGLSVFGADATTRVSMADKDAHTWTVNFQADSDGVFFINVSAEAELEGQPSWMRTYAVRLEIGEGAALAEKPANGQVVQQSDGEMAVIMEAEEVIE